MLFPCSKGTPSIPKGDICGEIFFTTFELNLIYMYTGIAEQSSSSKVDFIRLDRNEHGVHFNAKYVGKDQSVPSSAKKAAIFIDGATEDQFKKWAEKLKEATSMTNLWSSWYRGEQP